MPSDLKINLEENSKIQLGKHIVSYYPIRPVAFDINPFEISHSNPYNELKFTGRGRGKIYER
jgi:hypothetical protein